MDASFGKKVVSHRLRMLRAKTEMKQIDVARLLNITPVRINRIELSRAILSPEEIEQFSNLYHIDKEYLDYKKVELKLNESDFLTLFESDFLPYLKKALNDYKLSCMAEVK